MNPNKTFYEKEAREKLIEGAKQLYEAVIVTYGKDGGSVIIKRNGRVFATQDGVTVARNFYPEDPELAPGAELLRSAALHMNTEVGDGTTTVTLLAYQLLKETENESGLAVKRILEADLLKAEKVLKKMSKPAGKHLEDVAVVASNDPEMGKIVADTVKKIGKNGNVHAEIAQGPGVEVEMKDGYLLSSGFESPYFMTEEGLVSHDTPVVVVVKGRIEEIKSLMPLLESVVRESKSHLVLFSGGVSHDIISSLLKNKEDKILSSNLVRVDDPEQLKNIADLTGATVLNDESGNLLEEATIDQTGKALKVASSKMETLLVVDKEIEGISTKAAIILVGGATTPEAEERLDRAEDAIAAVKAAQRDGVVTGGGHAYSEIADQLPDGYLKTVLGLPKQMLGIKEVPKNIVDPTEVIRGAMRNAVSIAGVVATSGALLIEKEKV